MAEGRESEHVTSLLAALDNGVEATPVDSPKETVIYDHALTHLHELGEGRALRLARSRSSMHPALWAVVILGGILTIGFTYFFGLKNTRAHATMIAMLATVIASCVFLIGAIDRPFAGDVKVQPGSLQEVLRTMAPHSVAVGR